MESDRPEKSRVEQILKAGSEIAGSAIGGALGFFTGGPVGAAAAGAAGSAAGSLLADVATRVLSHREKVRVGAIAQFAYEQIRANLESGETIRQDGFFEADNGHRSKAEEVFEGVLLKAQREHQEMKLRYIGQFFGRVAFDYQCSAEQANYLLSLLERLTYQQLVMLRTFSSPDYSDISTYDPSEQKPWEKELIARREAEHKELREGLLGTMTSGGMVPDTYAAWGALYELFRLSLVEHKQENGLPGNPPTSFKRINFAATYTTFVGQQLNRLCGLETVPKSDIEELKRKLDYTASEIFIPSLGVTMKVRAGNPET